MFKGGFHSANIRADPAAIEAAAPAAGERVLDIGCGAGASSLALAARVGGGGKCWE